jgi:hypothetical protein
MTPRSALVAVSAVQLAANVAGQVVALRRRRAFDVPFLHGDPAHVGRDSWWFGTAYSAPSYMLAGQAYAVARLAAGPDDRARAMLRLLGTSMVPGYLSERFARQLLAPRRFDPVETPIVAVGLLGAAAMAVLGRTARSVSR